MAQRVEIILVDDIDGSAADEKVRFALDGVSYEIDLSAANAAKLRDALAAYVGNARRTSTRRGRGSGSGGAGSSATEIRAWAVANGYEINARGRVPSHIKKAYDAANG